MTTTATPPVAAEGGLGTATSSKRLEFRGFGGLRAIAALSVLVTHTSLTSGANADHPAGAFFARMDVGVSIFFLISGFLLYRPFVAARIDGRQALPLRDFMRRRALRIFPAYWVALTAVVFLLDHTTFSSMGEAFLFYALVHIYDEELIFGGIVQAWSLATELSFYVFLPLYAGLMRRVRGGFAAEVAGLSALAAGSVAWKLFVLADGTGQHRMTWLPAYLDLFALGMLLAVASVWSSKSAQTPKWVTALGRFGAFSWAGGAAAFWAVSTQLGLARDFGEITVEQALGRHGLYGLTALCLLAPAVFDAGRSFVVHFLAWRPMAALGLISYGIYLWHKAAIVEALGVMGAEQFDADLNELLGWTLVGTIAVAALSYVVIEQPALRLKGRTSAKGLGLSWRDAAALVAVAVAAFGLVVV